MAEALGGIASVFTIVEAVANVTKLILSCKTATKESRRLVRELSYIRGLFTTLKETIEEQQTNDTWSSTVLVLNDHNGLIHQFEQLLGLLESRIRGPCNERGLKKLRSILEWPFKEPEALKLIEAVERYKSLIELALDNNHIRLSKAIHDDVKDISSLVQDVLHEVKQGSQELSEVHSEIKDSRMDWQKTGQRLETQGDQSNQVLIQVHGEIKESRKEWRQTSQHIKSLGRRAQDAESEDIFKRLSTWNFWARQRDILSQRVGETGNWFLNTAEFTQWKTSAGRWLICYGAPGVGKSVLASVIVDHLQANVSANSRVLALYFDRAHRPINRYEDFLGSLLQQLTYDRCYTWDAIKTSIQRDRLGLGLTATDLLTLLKNELQEVEKTYLIIDALDEWSTEMSELSGIVSDLGSLGDNVSILITSRLLPQHEQLLQEKTRIDLQLPSTDLENYVRSRLSAQSISSFLKSDQVLQDVVTHTILEKCEGLFLLARLQMDLLGGKPSKKALLNTLRQLPRVPESLYDDIMTRLEARSIDEVDLAKRTFAWVLYAQEPPHLHLIQYALAIEPDDVVIDEDGVVDWETLISLCGGLIVVDSEVLTVRFVHPTTRSYFQKYFERQASSPEIILTSTCLTFFLSSTFRDSILDETRDKRSTPLSNGSPHMTTFLQYAARYLIWHYRTRENVEANTMLMKKIFNDTTCFANFWLVCMLYSRNQELSSWRPSSINDSDRLCIACYHGLKEIVSWLLESGISPNEKDTTGQRPLYAAARQGECGVVGILLNHGAQAHLPSFDDYTADTGVWNLGFTPMQCALVRGNLALAQFLVDRGVGVSSREKSTNLLLAIESQSLPMVEFVLQQQPHEDFLDAEDEDGALIHALKRGSMETIRVLLQHGAPKKVEFKRGLLPAFNAAIRAHRDCLATSNLILDHMTPEQVKHARDEVFLPYNTSTFLRYNQTETLTSLNIRFWRNSYNDPANVFGPLWQCLCEARAEDAAVIAKDPKLRDATNAEFEQSNVLIFSVYRGWRDIVMQLLQLADDLQCDATIKTAALCEAINCNQNELLPLILNHGPELDAPLSRGTALCAAALSQNLDVVQALLEAGANPNAKCPRFGSAMHAVCCDEESTVAYTQSTMRLLLEHNANLDLVCHNRGTVLTALAEISSDKSLTLVHNLLDQGADCNTTGGMYHTPMIAAAASSGGQSLRIMYLLQAAGANLNAFAGMHGTALLAALEPKACYSSEKVMSLFDWGADVTIPGPKATLVELAAQHPHAVVRGLIVGQSGSDSQGDLHEALIAAAASSRYETMIQLIERGADVNGKLEIGGRVSTPLMAALTTDGGQTLQTVQLLVAYGVNLDAPINRYSNSLQMYLDRRIVDYSVVEFLLNSGVSQDAPGGPNGSGSASEIAVRRYKEYDGICWDVWRAIIQLLLEHGAVFSASDFDFLMEQSWFVELVTMGTIGYS